MSTSRDEGWKDLFRAEFEVRRKQREAEREAAGIKFPSEVSGYNGDDVVEAMEPALDGQLTFSENVLKAQEDLKAYLGVDHVLLTHSGESTLLLAVSAMINMHRIPPRSEVLVSAMSCATTVFAIGMLGLTPVLCDVDPTTLCISRKELGQKLTPKTCMVIVTHPLGHSCHMDELVEFCESNKLPLLEDTFGCIGSKYRGQMLGTFGTCGILQFDRHSHIHTLQGGALVTNNKDVFWLAYSIRAHGWSRFQPDKERLDQKYASIDPRFLFMNPGYNFRPLEAIGVLCWRQLERLDATIAGKKMNRSAIIEALEADEELKLKIEVVKERSGARDPAWPGLALRIKERFEPTGRQLAQYLKERGIESLDLLQGNLAKHPALRKLGMEVTAQDFPQAQDVETRVLVVALPAEPLGQEKVGTLISILRGFEFVGRDVVLVTGGSDVSVQAVKDLVEASSECSGGKDWAWACEHLHHLEEKEVVAKLFDKHQPTHVLHLSATVPFHPSTFHVTIATHQNILEVARDRRVKKLVAVVGPAADPMDADASIRDAPNKVLRDATRMMCDQYRVDFATVNLVKVPLTPEEEMSGVLLPFEAEGLERACRQLVLGAEAEARAES